MPPRTHAELLRQRDLVAARLNDPTLSAEDTDLLCTEAEQIRSALVAHDRRAALLGTDSTRSGTGTSPARTYTTEPRVPTSIREAVEAFVQSDQVGGFRANGYTGRARLEFPTLDTRALITTGSSGFQNPDRVPGATLANPDRPLRIVDLINQQTTTQNAVEWVRDNTAAGSGAAAEVLEGNLKPEAAYTFELVTDPVQTVAHWTPITRQAMDDSPSLVQHVENRLMYGLDRRLDAQVLNGDGTAPNLRGILNTSGRGVYNAPAGEAPIVSVRKAVTVAQQNETTPDCVVLNPADWERIELSTDADGMFRVSPTVANALAPRIWGLNVVATTAIPGTAPDPDGAGALTATVGRFLVGGFRMGATLWNRNSALLVSDNVGDDFLRNRLVILAERRVALSVMSPKAFVDGSFAA